MPGINEVVRISGIFEEGIDLLEVTHEETIL